MVLSNKEVAELIEAGVSPKIMLARKQAEKINMHYTGKNVVKFLEKIDAYETNAQKILREKLVRNNRSLMAFLLRPTDKIFTAKGGSVSYNLSHDKIEFIKKSLSDVADGLDIKTYLKKVVKKHFVIDPNGVIFIDIDSEGKLETHIITTEKIFWYENKGNKVNAIIFAPYKTDKKEDQDEEFYRVIDSETDRIFVKDASGDSVTIYPLVKETFDNYFGYVPAIILGDEKNPNDDIYESIIADIVPDADKYLRDTSITTIHDLAHLYPRYWSYAQACTQCEGEGTIKYMKGEEEVTKSCNSCGGTGVKTVTNPSDEIIVPKPQDGETPIAPNLAGFISPDLETARFYDERAKKTKNDMFQAMWGTTYEQGGKRETATGRFLDSQPVQDRLKPVSDTFAKFYKFMLDCYGKVLLREPSYESSVTLGKRYILEGPDDILKLYMESSRENISELGILDLRDRYFDAQYQDDNVELLKRKKLAKIEPFPTMKVSDVMALVEVPAIDRLKKMYFSSWTMNLSNEQIIYMTLEQLEESLNKYIASKTLAEPKETKPEITNLN